MASIKVKFRPGVYEDREGRIFYQIIHGREVRKLSSDYRLYNKEWDCRRSRIIVSGDSDRREYLRTIWTRIRWDTQRFKRIILGFTIRGSDFSVDDIVEEFVIQQKEQSFFSFMEAEIIRLQQLGRQRTSETYTCALNSFRRFRKDEEVVFDGFDTELMESYESYLSDKGLIPNSISFHMRILRAVYNRAVEKGITDDKKPFRRVYTGIDKTIRRAVNVDTIRKIKGAELGDNPKLEYARDMFLLSFYFRGMSFVDMAYLRKADLSDGQISYRRRKTGQLVKIKWTSEMQEVLGKYSENDTEYLLPIITSKDSSVYSQYRSKQFQINKGLKEIAEKIGLNMALTLYCSRHSWASIAKAEGIPIGVISDALGHDSELTTRIYLSTLDTSAVDNANDEILKLL